MERKKLKEAVKLVNSVIAEEGSKLRKIIEGDEDSHVMVDGETETGYCCQIQVDAKMFAEVYLRTTIWFIVFSAKKYIFQ